MKVVYCICSDYEQYLPQIWSIVLNLYDSFDKINGVMYIFEECQNLYIAKRLAFCSSYQKHTFLNCQRKYSQNFSKGLNYLLIKSREIFLFVVFLFLSLPAPQLSYFGMPGSLLR